MLPALMPSGRRRRWPAVQRHVLAASHPHAHLRAFEAIEPAHALSVDPPALTAEQDVNAVVAEPRPRSAV